MAKIGDEIRDFVKRSYEDEYMDPKELLALADRIDAEMVELPRDANGKPIHVGETVYDLDGYEHMAVSNRLYSEEDPTWMVSIGDGIVYPRDLTHNRPDSLERIADELDEMVRGDHTVESFAQDWERLHELCLRIRKQMKEREHE